MDQYTKDIQRFQHAMMYKLNVHRHKGRWEDMTVERAMELLMNETVELEAAIREGNLIEIMLEAADIANFAMIIATIAVERGK